MAKRQRKKADAVLDAAAELFSVKPFHEVRLEDIAAHAQVGKGTVYLYWPSKEEVYLAVIRRGFAGILEQLDGSRPSEPLGVWADLRMIVEAVIGFAYAHPGVFRIMRSGSLTPEDPELQRTRRALAERIEGVLRQGIESGVLADACPALTTQYLLSFVRGAMLYPPEGMTKESLAAHIMGVLRRGIAGGGPA